MPIRKTKGGYKIKNVKGTSKTKTAAKRRMKAVKARQSGKSKKKGCSCKTKRR